MSTEKTNARNRHAAPIGLVFIVLCVIGLCTVFNWCYGLTRNLADNTAQKTKYEQMLLPVVMFDPPDFTDPATCDNEFLLQSSLWACMLGERRGSYEFDEYGRMVIPAADAEREDGEEDERVQCDGGRGARAAGQPGDALPESEFAVQQWVCDECVRRRDEGELRGGDGGHSGHGTEGEGVNGAVPDTVAVSEEGGGEA